MKAPTVPLLSGHTDWTGRPTKHLPVEVVVDPGALGVDVLDGGHVRLRVPRDGGGPGLDQDMRGMVANAVMRRFEPKRDVLFRFTNNKDEARLAADGALRPSRNHADGTTELGVSVADGPHYAAHGYRYGYMLTGNVIGGGSDGEPIVDPKSIKVIGRIARADAMASAHNRWRAGRLHAALAAAGWTDEQYRAALTWAVGFTPTDFARLANARGAS